MCVLHRNKDTDAIQRQARALTKAADKAHICRHLVHKCREKETGRNRDRQRQTEADRGRQRQTKTDKDKKSD